MQKHFWMTIFFSCEVRTIPSWSTLQTWPVAMMAHYLPLFLWWFSRKLREKQPLRRWFRCVRLFDSHLGKRPSLMSIPTPKISSQKNNEKHIFGTNEAIQWIFHLAVSIGDSFDKYGKDQVQRNHGNRHGVQGNGGVREGPPGSLTNNPWKYTIPKGKYSLPTFIFQELS